MADRTQALQAVEAIPSLAPAPMASMGLFVDASGHPLVFILDASVPTPHIYESHIESHGGMVQNGPHLSNSPIVLSTVPLEIRSFKPEFIDDSVRSGRQQTLDKYAQPTKKRPLEDSDDGKPRKNTYKFTPEADAYILEQVRMKPRYRTSHKFFEELAHHDILKAHTGNSIRSRYRAHLEHKLNYVYKTDLYDNLVLDEAGQKFAVPVASAKTMKNKFTADEDFHLCKDVIEHVLKTQPVENAVPADLPEQLKDDSLADLKLPYLLDENKFSVSISWFDEYARKHPSHSSSSWRDRYRKFARVYGLQQYLKDYISAINTKESPQPMSRLTSRSSATKQKKEKKRTDAVHALVSSDLGLAQNEVAVANMAVNSQHDALPLDEEIGETKDSNIHAGLRGVGAGQNIADDMVINPDLASRAYSDAYDDMDSQDIAKEMEYLPRNTSLDDLFTGDMFKRDSSQILGEVVRFLSRGGGEDVEKVIDNLAGIGFSRKFVGHILRVTSAHAMYINQYLEHVFHSIERNNVRDLEDVLYIHGRDGFWTPAADDALMNHDFSSLHYMSTDSIAHRRVFLGLEYERD